MKQIRVVVVVNMQNGTVYGVTTDNEEARGWTRDLCQQYKTATAAAMTAALVDVPDAVLADLCAEVQASTQEV